MEISLSTIIPSIWKKVFSWQASVASLRKQRPGKIALIGTPFSIRFFPYLRRIAFCAAEVWDFRS